MGCRSLDVADVVTAKGLDAIEPNPIVEDRETHEGFAQAKHVAFELGTGLIELIPGLSAHTKLCTGGSIQVAFVGGVDEDLAAKLLDLSAVALRRKDG